MIIRRLLLAAIAVAALAGCRADVGVRIDVGQNGSGTITVTATVDQAVVVAAPTLVDDLRLDDVRAAGWVVDGPDPTAEGGLTMTLTHGFDTPEQATALLADLSGPDGPLRAVALSRDASRDGIDYRLSGSVGLVRGVSSFADPDVLQALGAAPYASQIAASGVPADEAVSVQLLVALPGGVRSTTGEATALDGTDQQGLTWTVPIDGTRLDVTTATRVDLHRGGIWRVLPTVAFALLVAWTVAATVVIGRVVLGRRRRAQPPHPPATPSA